jgi:Raf kinase inhibitor-like YbhB/YbcL family protein
MKLTSNSITHGQAIPATYAFAEPDKDEHIKLSDNRNPHLAWDDVPEQSRSLVLICTDPDVPSAMDDFNQEGRTIAASLARIDFIHWVMIDLPPNSGSIAEGACSDGITPGGKPSPAGPDGSRQGTNDYTGFFAGDNDMGGDYLGYDGPCPPWNDEIVHHYHFKLYAIDLEKCPVGERFTAADVLAAIAGHEIAAREIRGTYSLNPEVPA